MLGVVDFGITESWTVGWLALHVALLLRYARTGGARWAVGAAAPAREAPLRCQEHDPRHLSRARRSPRARVTA